MEETPVPIRASVLIVSFDSGPALRRCIAALENSAGRDTFEVIVVDNGSHDDTPQVEQEFPSITFLRLPRNFGFTKALNIGMRTAKSELFLILDPRVEVQPDTVTALAERLEGAPAAVGVAPLLVTPEGEPAPQLYRLPGRADIGALARAGAFTPAPVPALEGDAVEVEFAAFTALMVRAYFLKGLRHIDERYAQTWGDAEIAMQIRRANRKTLLAPGIKATFHPEPSPFDHPALHPLVESDWVSGAVTYAGKHFGFATGLAVRAGTALRGLAGFRFAVLSGALSGRKIDGTQPLP